MESHQQSQSETPNLTPLLDVPFTTPDYNSINSIMATWRDIPTDTASASQSYSSCVATPKPAKVPSSISTAQTQHRDLTSVSFLAMFGREVQDKALGKFKIFIFIHIFSWFLSHNNHHSF